MKTVKLEINGREVEVDEGTTVLEAAEKLEIKIPTLCAHKALTPYGACRLCLVEVALKGRVPSVQTSCTYPALDGLKVTTDTERIINARKIMIELMLAKCPDSKVIKELAAEFGVPGGRLKEKKEDCILCGLCTRMCAERMGRSAIGFTGRGLNKKVSSPFGKPNEVCQTCGACDFICPTEKLIFEDVTAYKPEPILDEFNIGLNKRPAVYTLYPQAVPNVATIDEKLCVHMLSGDCGVCKEVCEADAINYDQKEEKIDINAGAVILANGIGVFDANEKAEYGFDRYDNVVTNIQFERFLSSSGPTQGEVVRPSDGKHPEKIAFIQCIGSRDPSCGNEFCSSTCCMASIKEAVIAREHDARIKPTIFYIDIRTFGKDFERYYEDAKNVHGVNFERCMISKIYEKPKSKNVMVKYVDPSGQQKEAEFDMVVLAVGMTDTSKSGELVSKIDIETNEYGFAKVGNRSPGCTTAAGVFVAGTFAEPKDIPETVAEGSSSAALASALLSDSRGSLVVKKEYPPERDISAEEVRIGVFICRCGRNIASVVDVPRVVEFSAKLPGVVFASEFLYSCSKDSLDMIKQYIAEHDLNRVVVASCTPRTHEALFRDTVREAGLNRFLFEMTSLREQVSWVHRDDPVRATEKANELVAMMVAKTRLVNPLKREFSDTVQKAMVLGGGASGMRAALSVAEQGYEVYLVEKEASLGGHLKDLYYNLEDSDTASFLATLIEKVSADDKIHVMMSSKLKETSGFVGNYKSIIGSAGEEKKIEHGVIIVATGAKSYEPEDNEFGYGSSDSVMTQVDLEGRMVKKPEDFSKPQTYVMIQCVGSRDEKRPYCSRICCAHAIKNALKLKAFNEGNEVIVLYRDIRTYGFMEKYYLEAREKGVIFSCYDKEKKPEVRADSGGMMIRHMDRILGKEVMFAPDKLVLSAGISPGDNDELTKILKVPLNQDGFFLDAHAKIRPLDFTADGIFFCGLAHSPRSLTESLMQAQGASIRGVTVLSKEKIEAKAITACVNERVCTGCGLCVTVCPYDAREIDEETRVAQVIDVMCQGCGACAVACPSGATSHKGFTKKEILLMTDVAVGNKKDKG